MIVTLDDTSYLLMIARESFVCRSTVSSQVSTDYDTNLSRVVVLGWTDKKFQS